MPANARQTYKQELDRASGNLDWAIEHLRRMAEAYRVHHEEVTEVCELSAGALMAVQELIDQLKKMI